MVVRHNDGRGAIRQGIGENFPRMHRRPIDQPDGHDPDIQDFICPVDAGAEEVLLLAIRVMPHMGKQVGRRLDLRPLRLDTASGKFDGGKDQGCLGISHTSEAAEVFFPNVDPLFIDDMDQFPGQGHHIQFRRSLAQHYG